MSQLGFELNKLIKNGFFIGCLFAVCIANVFISYVSENKSVRQQVGGISVYNDIYAEIEGMTSDEAYEYLDKKYEEAIYDDALMQFYMGYKTVLGEVRQCATYDEYLNQVQEACDKHGSIAIFSKQDSYADKNMEKTAKKFERLKGNELKTGKSRGIRLVTDNITVDFIAVILIMTVSYMLFVRERENGLNSLVRVCEAGRVKNNAAKVLALCVLCAIIEAVLYLPLAILAKSLYGFGDTGRLIQSVSGYLTTELSISVSQYLLIFFIAKLFVYIMFAMLFSFVMSLVRSSHAVYFTLVVIIAVSMVLFYTIDDSSYIMLLKNVNIYAFLNTSRLFSNYLNLRVINSPVDYRMTAFLCMAAVIVICAVGTVVFGSVTRNNSKEINFGASVVDFINRHNPVNRFYGGGVTGNELYKLLIKCRIFILCALSVFVIFKIYSPPPSKYPNVEDVYEYIAVSDIEGEYTEEKAAFIDKQIADIESGVSDKYEKAPSEWLGAYMGLKEKTERIKDIENSVYMYDRGYALLTGTDTESELMLMAETLCIVILIVSGIWCVEYAGGMKKLINTTPMGRKPTEAVKLVTAFVLSAGVFLLVHLLWIFGVLKKFGGKYLDAPACILEHLEKVPQGITIRQIMIFSLGLKLLLLFAVVCVIRIIAAKSKSQMMTMLISSGLFVIPPVVLRILKGL